MRLAGAVALLLLAAVWLDGAFDLRHWAPLGAFVTAVLAAMLFTGALRPPASRHLQVALGALWAFAAWTLLSALWADSTALAWEGAARTVLYAGVVTIALCATPDEHERRWVGLGLVAGVGLIGAVMLVRILSEDAGAFLAGRLDDPTGYRNGTAALFAFGVWPLLGFAAVRGALPSLRAAGFAGAVLLLGLAFMTQSRGVMIGLAAGAVVSLAIGPDRLRRSWLALAALGAIAVVSGPLLGPYDAFDTGTGQVPAAEIGDAGVALLLVTLASFAVAMFGSVLDNGLRGSPGGGERGRRLASGALAALVAVGLVGALVSVGNPIDYADDKIEEFQDLEPEAPSDGTRLGSVGGQRYDLWRVAWEEFEDAPVAGVGEGSYAFGYYRERRTDRNLSDPHSLPFRLLAETGLVGTLLFAVFAVALGLALARRARGATAAERRWISGLGAAGVTVLAQSLTDWLWLLPAVTGLGLLALGLAAAGGPAAGGGDDRAADGGPARGSGPTPSRWAQVAAGVALAGALVAITLLFLSDLYVRKAREQAAAGEPAAQLDDARTAETLNPAAVTPLYLQASALESEGRADEAREALLEALEQEPANFVTLGLLGDLETRAGDEAAAREYYRRALELNPLDVGLQELAG